MPSPNPHPRRRRRASLDPLTERIYSVPGAGSFADDPSLLDPARLIRALKAQPDLVRTLEAGTSPVYAGGRRRKEGSWALLYLAFITSGLVDVKTFCDRWGSSTVWDEAGFGRWKPNYRTLWLRFAELEDYAHVFQTVAQHLVQRARRHEPRIGRHVHIDGSGFTTHAKVVHRCPDREACRHRRTRVPSELRKARQEIVEAARHRDSAASEDEAVASDPGITYLQPNDPRLDAFDDAERTRYQWVLQRGHIFRLADRSAGVRKYDRGPRSKQFWVGGQLLLMADDLLNLPLAVHCQSAREQEWANYPAIYAQAEEAVSGTTVSVTTDRGFHFRSVFEHNLARGISTIGEWRQPQAGIWPENLECTAFDRDGVVRCRHCGDGTNTRGAGLGLHRDQRGNPYLLVRCEGRHTPACSQPQRVSCSLEPRLLQPINRTTKLFWNLHEAHKNKEGIFLHFRWRYNVAGNDFADRPKRRQSVPCQQLRASAGMLIDWLRACLKHNWFASARHPQPLPSETCVERTSGYGNWRAVMDRRDSEGLWLPYGPAAHALGLAPDATVPAQRGSP